MPTACPELASYSIDMQVPLLFWILDRCNSMHSYAIFIKRWKWILSIFSISTFAASTKLLLGVMTACYPERSQKKPVSMGQLGFATTLFPLSTGAIIKLKFYDSNTWQWKL